jgi:hypothetical protein
MNIHLIDKEPKFKKSFKINEAPFCELILYGNFQLIDKEPKNIKDIAYEIRLETLLTQIARSATESKSNIFYLLI